MVPLWVRVVHLAVCPELGILRIRGRLEPVSLLHNLSLPLGAPLALLLM